MGDWIMFRGRRRFVIGVRSAGLLLDRLRPSRFSMPAAYYTVGSVEKARVRVVKRSTTRSRARARKTLESNLPPWTSIVWDGDQPTYVHDPAKFP
jgi:hypothetical protein